MKRFGYLIISLLAVAWMVNMLTVQAPRKQSPLALVPRDAMLVVDWTDPAGAAKGFLQSSLGESLTSIEWQHLLKKLELPLLFQAQFRYTTAKAHALLKKSRVQQFFSHRTLLVLMPFSNKNAAVKDLPEMLSEHMFLIVRSDQQQDVTSLFSLFSYVPVVDGTESYQGVVITALEDGNQVLYAAQFGQYVAVSPGVSTIKQIIDLSTLRLIQDETGLLLNTSYTDLRKRTKGSEDFFLYADLSALKVQLKHLQAKTRTEYQDGKEYAGVKQMAFFSRASQQTRYFSSIVQFDKEALAPFQHIIYTRPPVINHRFGRVPAELLVYVWTNWLDLKGWWQQAIAKGYANGNDLVMQLASWLEKQSEIDMDSLLSLFGQQVSFTVTDIHTSGFIPAPRICFWVEVLDRERVAGLLDTLVADMPVRRRTINGVSVVSIMAAHGLMQPSYALTDRVLIVADSRVQIENILNSDVLRLAGEADFQAVDMGALKPSNLISFARIGELVKGLKELVSLAGTVIAIRDDAWGKKSKVLIEQVLAPLLDGLKMYRAKGIRSYTAPGEVVVEAAVLEQKAVQ